MIGLNLARRLTHTARWARPSNSTPTVDAYGDFTNISSPSAVLTIPCYATQDLQTAQSYQFIDANVNSWLIVLGKDRVDVVVGHLLENITDQFGTVLLSSAKIKDRKIFTHHRDGVRCILCLAEPAS